MSRPVGGPYGDGLSKKAFTDEFRPGRGFPGGPPIRGGRDRGGWNEGAAWNRRPARRDMDIVDKELNRYQPAFDHVQRYPEGYGGQPGRGGGRRGGGRRGGGMDDNKFDRFINAIEGIAGKGGGNITNTFNPTFNPTNVNAGRDIRDTSIIGGGPNTAGRDITGAGGDVETGDGGGGNTVNTNPVITNPGGTNPGGTDPGGTDPGGTDPGGTDPVDPRFSKDFATEADARSWLTSQYNTDLGRDPKFDDQYSDASINASYWLNNLAKGVEDKGSVSSNIRLGDEYKNREMVKSLAQSMENKSYDKDASTWKGGYSDPGQDFEPPSGTGLLPQVMVDWYNPTTGKYTQVNYGTTPKAGTGWVKNPNTFNAAGEGGYKYGDPNQATPTGKINESTIDGMIGPGGVLTQSTDEGGPGYFQGISTEEAAKLTGTQSLSDRDQKIYNLYTDVFGRNPDERGFQYWTTGDSDKMSLDDIEASFKGSVEAKVRDNIGGSNLYTSIDDYLKGKTSTSPKPTDGVPMGSNNASTGQSAPRSLAGDTDPATLGPVLKQFGLDTDVAPGTGAVTPLPGVVDGPPGAEIPGLETDPIGTLYGDLLGREPDAEGYKYWTDQLKSGNQTYDQIADNIMRSEEYQERRGGAGRRPMPIPPKIGDPGPRINPNPSPQPKPGPGVQIGRPSPSLPPRINPNPVAPTPGPGVQIGRPLPAPVRGVPGGTTNPNPTDWLQQAYTQAGLGKVDPGGRDYWMGDLGKGASKADVIANIMRHKK